MKRLTSLAACAASLIFFLPSQSLAETKTMNQSDKMKMADTMKKKVIKHGDLEIIAPMIRATLPNQPVSAGYMIIKNTGKESDRLVGGSAEFSAKTEIHEMAMENDVMKMRELADGLEIPAGDEVILKKGGLHVMFMKLSEQMVEGESRKVTLEFEKAGPIELEIPVKKVEMMGHGTHKMKK